MSYNYLLNLYIYYFFFLDSFLLYFFYTLCPFQLIFNIHETLLTLPKSFHICSLQHMWWFVCHITEHKLSDLCCNCQCFNIWTVRLFLVFPDFGFLGSKHRACLANSLFPILIRVFTGCWFDCPYIFLLWFYLAISKKNSI